MVRENTTLGMAFIGAAAGRVEAGPFAGGDL
jgi:hypothetical protein